MFSHSLWRAFQRLGESEIQNHIRRCEGGQAISFEEGSFVNVKVEFTHLKAIDFRSSRTVVPLSSIYERCTMQTGLIQNAHDDLVTDAAYDFYGLHLATCSLDQRSSLSETSVCVVTYRLILPTQDQSLEIGRKRWGVAIQRRLEGMCETRYTTMSDGCSLRRLTTRPCLNFHGHTQNLGRSWRHRHLTEQ